MKERIAKAVNVSIYQIVPERDTDRLIFMNYNYLTAHGYEQLQPSIYDKVFEGHLDVKSPEDVYTIFNLPRLRPVGYCGHSLSVSDVVEFHGETGKSEYYFCDSIGFKKVDFR